MKPVILITVHRRYRELKESLENICLSEFSEKPDIVVVWADPIISHYWFFQELLKEEKINHLVLRPKCIFDGLGATSHPESLNIRKGLQFVRENYEADCYVIVKAADVFPRAGILKWIDNLILENRAVLFYWENSIEKYNAWHTAFFAIRMDLEYWPPLDRNEGDVLEVQWAKLISSRRLPFYKTHNSRQLKFYTVNYEDKLESKSQILSNLVVLNLVGYIPWYRRLYRFFRRMLWLN